MKKFKYIINQLNLTINGTFTGAVLYLILTHQINITIGCLFIGVLMYNVLNWILNN